MMIVNILKNKLLLAWIGGLALLLGACQNSSERSEGLLMTGTSSDNLVKFAIDALPSSYAVSVTSTSCVEKDVKVGIGIESGLVDSYNAKMGTNYYAIPKNSFELSENEVVISAGKSISSPSVVSIKNDDDFVPGRVYLVPVTMKEVDGGMNVLESGRTIYLKVSRTLRFQAPYVGQAAMAYQFLLPDPIPSLPVYTWEVKIYATQFRSSGASGTTRVCSFGGSAVSVEGGA